MAEILGYSEGFVRRQCEQQDVPRDCSELKFPKKSIFEVAGADSFLASNPWETLGEAPMQNPRRYFYTPPPWATLEEEMEILKLVDQIPERIFPWLSYLFVWRDEVSGDKRIKIRGVYLENGHNPSRQYSSLPKIKLLSFRKFYQLASAVEPWAFRWLGVPNEDILFISPAMQEVRANAKMFLSVESIRRAVTQHVEHELFAAEAKGACGTEEEKCQKYASVAHALIWGSALLRGKTSANLEGNGIDLVKNVRAGNFGEDGFDELLSILYATFQEAQNKSELPAKAKKFTPGNELYWKLDQEASKRFWAYVRVMNPTPKGGGFHGRVSVKEAAKRKQEEQNEEEPDEPTFGTVLWRRPRNLQEFEKVRVVDSAYDIDALHGILKIVGTDGREIVDIDGKVLHDAVFPMCAGVTKSGRRTIPEQFEENPSFSPPKVTTKLMHLRFFGQTGINGHTCLLDAKYIDDGGWRDPETYVDVDIEGIKFRVRFSRWKQVIYQRKEEKHG